MALRNVRSASYPAVVRNALNERRSVLIVRVGEDEETGELRYVDRDGTILKSSQASAQILEVVEEAEVAEAVEVAPEHAAEAVERAEEAERYAGEQGDGFYGVVVFDSFSPSPAGHARVRFVEVQSDGSRIFEDAAGTRYLQTRERRSGVEKL